MTFPLIPVKANVQVPMKESCNCCDKFTCNFFCCAKRSQSPKNKDEKDQVEKIDSVSKKIMDTKGK